LPLKFQNQLSLNLKKIIFENGNDQQ
jgi:hypothetical protein